MWSFKVLKTHGLARAGILQTRRGRVETPLFMPVGTQGTVKALSPEDLVALGAQIILGNTYHLYLRPGQMVIRKMGGLHRFMGWDKVILTDSGGYQVSSLGWFKRDPDKSLSRITARGVHFKSHIDGSSHFLSPQKSIIMQRDLNSDIVMAFDEATPVRGRDYAREAMERTHRWLVQSVKAWQSAEQKQGTAPGSGQALFGIVQGGSYRDLRRQSASFVLSQPVMGIALGGATMGRGVAETRESAAMVNDLFRKDGRPVYFMGVGVSPTHAIGAVQAGADMFDCVAPTKWARTGLIYQGRLVIPGDDVNRAYFESEFENERITIGKRQFATDRQPIDQDCDCYTCRQGFSRAYLHHLFKAKELLYYRLASLHNVRVMIRTVQALRAAMLKTA